MAIPSEYAYLLDDWDFKWAGTDTYVYESGYKLWYNAGWSNNPVDITNTSFARFDNSSSDFGSSNITPIEPLTINITDNNSNVTVTYTGLRYFWAPNANPTYPNNYIRYVNPSSVNTSNQRLVAGNYDWYSSNTPLSYQTSFNNLATCISYIHSNFRHATIIYNGEQWVPEVPIPTYTSNGGGATHIAKVTGQLKDLSASNILLVSGGGGGGLLLGDSGWHGTEEDLIWSGNNNKMTVLKDGDDIKFKFYTNGTAIYTVTSQLADVSKIYVSFLADSENQVMKPSFIYETASGVYSYNQEEPTDEQMGDLYTWLSAGLTSN